MSKLSKLLQVTEEEKIAILKQHGTNETEIHKSVHLLKQWISQCSHLPNEDNERKLRNILFNCKMNIERAKQAIEGYFRVRTMYSNEMFDRLIPNGKEYMLAKKYVRTVVMPKLTPDLCRVTIYKMLDPSGEAYNAFLYEMLVIMMAEIRLATDFYLSNTIVIDFETYGWKNLIKFTPSLNQMLADVMISTQLRIHAIHFINMPNFIDQIMTLVKSFIPSKIVEKDVEFIQ